MGDRIDENGEGIVILSQDGIILQVNPVAEVLFNRPAEQLIGNELGHPVMAGEYSEIELVRANGQTALVEMRVEQTEWDGHPSLLAVLRDVTEQRRITQELNQAKRFNEAIFNALSSHIAVINQTGEIVAVNQAWETFAIENGAHDLKTVGVGSNYFEVCRRAARMGDEWAARALLGLQTVLSGQQAVFELEYPCHHPDKQRWFLMRATSFASDGWPGLVVAHVDITEQKLMIRQEVEQEIVADLAQRRQSELSTLETLARLAPLGRGEEAAVLPTLRERMPERFAELSAQCARLLDLAVQKRTFDIHQSVSGEMQALAEYLGLLKVGPRDVMEIYLDALKSRVSENNVKKSNVYIEEGRVLVLELMGYVLAFYRNYLPPVIRNPIS
ncbi:MAG: PAS domain-containing protein [Chloroflexi bacterium]|nr:PAS domain-containing protein [Chloroflexota bacterium]